MHFTPTSASWLNIIERFFRSITVDRLRRGVFKSAAELKSAIHAYIAAYNIEPKPFVWTAKANDILPLQKVMRGREALENSGSNSLKHYTSVLLASSQRARVQLPAAQRSVQRCAITGNRRSDPNIVLPTVRRCSPRSRCRAHVPGRLQRVRPWNLPLPTPGILLGMIGAYGPNAVRPSRADMKSQSLHAGIAGLDEAMCTSFSLAGSIRRHGSMASLQPPRTVT